MRAIAPYRLICVPCVVGMNVDGGRYWRLFIRGRRLREKLIRNRKSGTSVERKPREVTLTDNATRRDLVDRLVKFDLPFPVLMQDSLKVPEDERDEAAFAEPIYVAGDPPAAVRVALRPNLRPDVVSRGVLEGGDPYGRVTYTRMQTRFNVATSPEILEWSDDRLIDEALRVANRVIEVYRNVADRPILRHVVRDHIVHFLVMNAFEGEEIQVRAVSRARGPLRVGLGEPELTVEEMVRARLQTEQPVEFGRELYLDTRSHLETEDYRLAVIESEVLFEVWLKGFLAEHLQRQGLAEEDVQSRFSHADGRPRSVTNLAKGVVHDVTGFDFSGTAEYERWDQDARKLRNEVVHGQRRIVTREEAVRALEAIIDANHVLQDTASLDLTPE